MRAGFTKFPNEAFSLGLKPNELALLVYLLSHEESFTPSITHICKNLNIKFETVKRILPTLVSKIKAALILDPKLKDTPRLVEKILKRSTRKTTQTSYTNNIKISPLSGKVFDFDLLCAKKEKKESTQDPPNKWEPIEELELELNLLLGV